MLILTVKRASVNEWVEPLLVEILYLHVQYIVIVS